MKTIDKLMIAVMFEFLVFLNVMSVQNTPLEPFMVQLSVFMMMFALGWGVLSLLRDAWNWATDTVLPSWVISDE